MIDMKPEPVKDSSPQYSETPKSSGEEFFFFFTETTSTCIILIMSIHNILWGCKYESKTNFSIGLFFQDAHERDSDKDDNVEDHAGEEEHKTQEETKPGPKVSITDRTIQTPVGTQREMDPRQSHFISIITDGVGCSALQDSEREQMCNIRSGFAHSRVYPLELNAHLRDPSIPSSLFHSARVNTWKGCATADRAAPCGLSLAAPGRTSGTPGFPISLQQPTLVQVNRELMKHWNAY